MGLMYKHIIKRVKIASCRIKWIQPDSTSLYKRVTRVNPSKHETRLVSTLARLTSCPIVEKITRPAFGF